MIHFNARLTESLKKRGRRYGIRSGHDGEVDGGKRTGLVGVAGADALQDHRTLQRRLRSNPNSFIHPLVPSLPNVHQWQAATINHHRSKV